MNALNLCVRASLNAEYGVEITSSVEHKNQVFTESPAGPQPAHQNGNDTIFVLWLVTLPILVLRGCIDRKQCDHKLFVQGNLPRLSEGPR